MELTWSAVYDDGSTFDELDANGEWHGWAEVDQARVLQLRWMHGGLAAVTVDIPPGVGAKPFLFRRRTQVMPLDGRPQYNELKFLALGYEIDGQRHMLRVNADGTLVLTTRDD